MQMRLQRLLGTCQFARIDFVFSAQVVAMGLGVAAPLVVVGRHLARAVAFPALRIGRRQRRHFVIAGRFADFRHIVGAR
jgi:hypothetical protein